MTGNEFAELSAGTVQSRSHGTDGAPHNVGDLLVAIFLDVGEPHDLPLLAAELLERFGKRLAKLRLDVIVDWRNGQRAAARKLLKFIIIGNLLLITSLATAKFVAVQIRYDSIDPREEGRTGFEAFPRLINTNECFLREVACVGLVASQAIGEIIGRLTVPLDRVFQERRLVRRGVVKRLGGCHGPLAFLFWLKAPLRCARAR